MDIKNDFQIMIEKSPDAFAYHQIVTDESGDPVDYVFLHVNTAFEKMIGLCRASIIGKMVTQVLPGIKKYSFDWISVFGKIALEGKNISFEHYSQPLKRYYEGNAYRVKPGYFATVFRDTTIRIQDKRADREKIGYYVDKLSLLDEVSNTIAKARKPEIIFQAIVDGITRLTNMKSAAIYLFNNGLLKLEATYPPIPPDFPESYRIAPIADHPHIYRTIFSKQPVVIKDSLQVKLTPAERKICEIRKLRSLLYLPLIYQEQVIGVLIPCSIDALHEFSEMEIRICQNLASQAALAIKEAHQTERLEAILDYSPALISEFDINGRYLNVNLSIAAMFGQEASSLIGSSFYDLLPQETVKIFMEHINQVQKTLKPITVEDSLFAGDDELSFITTLFPLFDSSGQIRSIGSIAHEITDIKKSEKKLAHTLKEYRKAFEGIVRSMGSLIEQRDSYTAGHQVRVAKLAVAIARTMGLEEKQVEGLKLAAEIHDIGKIVIPSSILTKPGKLSDLEFAMIKTHPSIGKEVLKPIDFPWPLPVIIEQHHEKIDGSGYPGGLHKDDILLEARILCVADVVEAMASHRPYRPALGIAKALAEIKANKGVLYDEQIVDVCLALFSKKKFFFDQ